MIEGTNFRHVSVHKDYKLIENKNYGSVTYFIIPNSTSHTAGVKKKPVLIELNLYKN